MNRYKVAKEMGHSHESAIVFSARGIVDEEIAHPREEFEIAELHTVIANAREDISALTMLASNVSARLRRMEKLAFVAVGLLVALVFK